jgi:site-specific recombinase XerC
MGRGYKNPSTWKARGRQKPHYIVDLRQRLVRHAGDTYVAARGLVLSLLMLDGLSWQEACSLTLDQIRLDLGVVLIGNQNSKPISRDSIKAIERWLPIRNQRGPCQALITTWLGRPIQSNYINLSFHLRHFGRLASIHHNLSISTVELSRD